MCVDEQPIKHAKGIGGIEVMQFIKKGLRFVVATLIGASLTTGCTDEPVKQSARDSELSPPSTDGEYAIKAYVGSGKDRKLVKFGPIDRAPSATRVESLEADRGSLASEPEDGDRQLREQAKVEDNGEVYDTGDSDLGKGYAPGWTLASLAAKTCASGVNGASGRPAVWVFDHPWTNNGTTSFAHHLLRTSAYTCDSMLALQEVMLCTADRLAEIADSPGTVYWDRVYQNPGGGSEPIKVTIPPQATQDRFVARDMALNVLAALGQAMLRDQTETKNPTESCLQQYLDFAETPTSDAATWDLLLFSIYFRADGQDVDRDNVRSDVEQEPPAGPVLLKTAGELAEVTHARIALQANILSGAARLTKRLIQDSVNDDLAGAERIRSYSGDPKEGTRRMWGGADPRDPTDVPYYDTLRHAMKVLFGRLELSPNREVFADGTNLVWDPQGVMLDDPACMGFVAPGVMDALGPGHSARWSDLPPRSAGQAFALNLIEASGIVMPPTASYTRSGIQTQLLVQAAGEAGTSIQYFDVPENPVAQAIKEAFQGILEEDLRFALERNFDAFRLLTNYPPIGDGSILMEYPLADAAADSGLELGSAYTTISVPGGIVIKGGISRHPLFGNIMPRLAGAQAASQCDIERTNGASGETSIAEVLSPNRGWVDSFQNPFALAQVFARQLAMVRDTLSGTDANDLAAFAATAASEIKHWAGPGRVTAQPGFVDVSGGVTETEIEDYDRVYITGMTLDDLGVASFDELQQVLVRVDASNPVHTECLIGQREACPEIEEEASPAIFQQALTVTPDTSGGAYSVGFDGPVIVATFPHITAFVESEWEPMQAIPVSGMAATLAEAPTVLNVAIRGDEEINGGIGRFLAALKTADATRGGATTAVVSSLQEALANEVFGIGRADRTQRSCQNGGLSTSLTANYCGDDIGIKRNQFVPLANELTSEGTGFEDSWRHYLRVAKEAAAKADQLGRELIDAGIQRDIRQEAPLEEVANLCGTFPTVDGVGANSVGELDLESQDAAIQACMNPKTIDVVFIGEDPVAGYSGVARAFLADRYLRALYCPSQYDELSFDVPEEPGTDAPFCSKSTHAECQADWTKCITHAGLGFLEKAVLPTTAPIDQVCGGLVGEANDGGVARPDPTTLKIAVRGPLWSTETGLAAALSSYRLLEGAQGEWVLLYDDTPVLANTAWVSNANLDQQATSDIYPACLDVTNDPNDPDPNDDLGNCSDKAKWAGRLIVRPSSNLATATSAEARARAQDAVHGLAGLAGRMPAGTIEMPMPVANFDALEALGADCLESDSECPINVPVWTVYSPGRFELEAGGTYALMLPEEFEPEPGTVAMPPEAYRLNFTDRELLGSLREMTDLYLEGRSNSAWYPEPLSRDFLEEIGPWSAGYLLVTPRNREIVYQEDIVNYDGTIAIDAEGNPVPGSGSTRTNLATWYSRFADNLNAADWHRTVAPLFHREQRSQTGPGVLQGGVCDYQELGGPVFVSNYNKANWDAVGVTIDPNTGLPIPGDGPVDTGLGEYWPHIDLFNNPNGGSAEYLEVNGTMWGWRPAHGVFTDNESHITPTRTGLNDQVVKDNLRSFTFGGLKTGTVSPFGIFWNIGFPFAWGLGINNGELAYREAVDNGAPVTGWPLGYHRLSPKMCSPGMRVELALPAPTPDTVLRGLGMSCLASIGGFKTEVVAPPSNIDSVQSIRALEGWMNLVANTVNTVGGLLFLTDVPESVVDAIENGTVDSSAVGQGTGGQIKLDIAEDLRTVQNGFAHLAIYFDKLRAEMQSARNRIQRASLDEQAAQLALQRDTLELNRQQMVDNTERALRDSMRTYRRMSAMVDVFAGGALATSGMYGAISGNVSGSIQGVAQMAKGLIEIQSLNSQGVFDRQIGHINDQFYSAVAGVVAQQGANAEQRYDNDVQAALIDLSLDSQNTYSAITDTLTAVQNSTSNALGGLNQLRLNQQSAAVAMAKAAGADFVQANGELVPLHLNTVYRRQFGVLKERYERALSSAKRAAYLARLAIEQRLGTRFDNLDQDIGPLEAPSQWINDLCSLQGVDYAALRDATVDASPDEELDLIAGFADQFVGDYVDKLEELVEFYNLESPFKESDDTAVLSLREVLGKTGQSCVAESANLLFHSDELEAIAMESLNHVARRGWRNSGCDDTVCLVVESGLALRNGHDALEPPEGVGRSTWLRTVMNEQFVSLAPTSTQFGAPPNVVYQSVRLDPGERYSLSWWDMARSADGSPLGEGVAEPYRVVVYNDQWEPVASFVGAPHESSEGTEWSPRRRIEFLAFEGGEYHFAFTPSLPGGAPQSVAIANVQLEREAADFRQSGYQSTSQSRTVQSGECASDEPAAFRARFSHSCEEGLCYYELNDLLTVDTELLGQGKSPLLGQVARGNFNYRHLALAVNIVGTGVLDCSGSGLASCYGSGFVEYDLFHRAHDVPLLDYNGEATCFNFSSGQIRSGKALSTERFLTLPLSSADQELISQNSIRRTQLAGRPLSGSYSLRIRETPALDWEKVEDIQLVIDYRQWSHIR